MPTPRINGRLGPVRQGIRISYDPTRGQHIEIPYESAGNHLLGAALQFQNLRIAYDLEPRGSKSRLVARASGPQVGVPDVSCDDWQILANENQKAVQQNPQFQNVSPEDLRTIKKFINDPDLQQEPALTDPNADELYDCLLHDITHYAYGQYVIRHTTNVSNNSGFNIADFNVERLYSFGQLIGANGELRRSDLWNFPMPGRLVTKLELLNVAISAGGIRPPDHPGYFWSWRKLPSSETTASGDRINITTEYWLEQWRVSLYPLSAYNNP